ncbi:MAG: hypothetical protein A2Z72_05395 [Omnitrophica bacterium RBG_13_46_9]|nr:MAG: hypothetical protein A2Z72_05395 [Omnitrophica bacterium RBG_13_46_9]
MNLGRYIRKIRMIRNIGQRELSRMIGVSASYINDIESGKRNGPSKEVLKKIAYALEANLEYLYDLAGENRKRLPHDIPDIVKKYKHSIQLLRAIRDNDVSEFTIKKITEKIMEDKMKAIIIAAGAGNRLKRLTKDKPKCMLELNGKTLLEIQMETLRKFNINDIIVIKGYKKEEIAYKGVRYYINDDYRNNNILNSLFYAENEIEGDVVVSYSDIVYEKKVIERLLEAKGDITIVVDVDWKRQYVGRRDHPVEEAENVIIGADNKVVEIGKILTDKNEVHGEFIGFMKLTKRGSDILKRNYTRAKELFWGKPFQRAKTFQQAYLTDMLQDLIYTGVDVHCIIIESGWYEIDTAEDYRRVSKEFVLT